MTSSEEDEGPVVWPSNPWFETQTDGTEDLLWSEDLVPTFAFGSILTMCFGALESLLTELVLLQEERCQQPFCDFVGGKGAPKIERQRLYLERVAGWEMEWAKGERTALQLLQTARNKWAHALGEGLSTESRLPQETGPLQEVAGARFELATFGL